ncbi:MAG TPA: SMP-30/gluconolactonase/LRE family protein, partial [Actinomycetota bacterium]|nr:SMP-30/gluconolactonase/LRE family protein [Actinomycetota bacterium]
MLSWNPRELAGDLGFPEGPVALGGGVIAFTDIRHQRVARYAPDEGVTTLARAGGGPNGLAVGGDGALYL